MTEQLIILLEILLIDLVLAGDNAIIIGMVASRFKESQRKQIIFWGIGGAVILRIILTLLTAYLFFKLYFFKYIFIRIVLNQYKSNQLPLLVLRIIQPNLSKYIF